MTIETFQRARRPEQINARREAILAAAAELFDEGGPEAAGLNAIAARAGFTKSNVYRYFESREAVLLSLFVADFTDFAVWLETALPGIEADDCASAARVIASAFLDRPRLGQLLGILSSVLEHNLSEAAVVELKEAMLALSTRIAVALSRAVPSLPLADCAWVTGVAGTYAAGMWPSAFPNPVVAAVMARPEYRAMKLVPERDLERMILVLLKGLMAG